jgi:hypothetical protein
MRRVYTAGSGPKMRSESPKKNLFSHYISGFTSTEIPDRGPTPLGRYLLCLGWPFFKTGLPDLSIPQDIVEAFSRTLS